MLFISDHAKSRVLELKQESGLGEDFFIRISVTGGGCSGLSYDLNFDSVPQDMDQVFEDKGVKLVTDLKSFLYLCDTTLDFSGGLDGKGFHFQNPNASRSCACGESFSV
jgi:iron-sulfur cluster assembly protein